MLKVGTKAPGFELKNQNGETCNLENYKGSKVLLYFYSKDNTSGCTKQAVSYSGLADEFESLGVKIVAISKDTVESHKKFEQKHDLSINLLADPEKKVLEAYDVLKEKKQGDKITIATVRTTYVIDADGVIEFADNKVKAAENAEKMIQYFKELQQ